MATPEIVSYVVAVVSVMGAIATAIFSFRNNSNGMKNDIISTYEKRMKQMEDDMETMKNDLAQVKVLLEKSEADRIKAESILQGRNPELDKYMTVTLQMLADIHGAVMPQTVTQKPDDK